MRQSFLQGFDVPFVLVDVELVEQADLRLIGRLLDGPGCTSWDRRRGLPGVRGRRPGRLGAGVHPGESPLSGRMAASNRVAIVGYAQSAVERHAPTSLGALAVETARAAMADAGLGVGQVDGFVTGSLFPTSGSHAAEDGVSLVSANWLAERLGVNPSYAAGFQGFGQIPGRVDGRQRRRQWRSRLRPHAPGAAQSARQVSRERHARGARCAAVDRATGLLRPTGHDRPDLQRVRPALRGDPGGHGGRPGGGPQERGQDPLVLLARPAAGGRGLPGRPR